MKSINIVLTFLIACLVLTSCENELNINPEQNIDSETALSTEANILNLLIGVYAEAVEGDTSGGYSQIIGDLLGSTDQVSWNGTFSQPREFFLKDIFITNFFVEIHWANSYEVINQANLVLDHLDLITSSDALRFQVEGEAKFLRALAYFDLIRFYSQQYDPNSSNSDLGVPLGLGGIIDFSGNLSLERSSVETIYHQIISDLNDAYLLLPISNDVFADKYTVQALLARVYLQQNNYEAARDAAHDVISNSGHSLVSDFELAFNNNVDGSEDIFAFQVTDQDGSNSLISHYASQDNGGRGGDIAIEQGYLDLFDDPNNDVRASFFYISPDNGLLLTSKYSNLFGNIPFLRVAEMHLIRAETNFRLGTSIGMDALSEINVIRSRSNASPLSVINLDSILNERQLELGFEGFLIHDLRRTQSDVGIYPFNASNLVLPIPQVEMDSNSLIEQNPGYGN